MVAEIINNVSGFLVNNTADSIGWAGNFAFLMGGILLARKNLKGWYCNFVANFAYVLQGILLTIPSLIVISIVLMVINIIGVKHWKRERKLEGKIILPDKDIAVLFQVNEFLKYVEFFANQEKILKFKEFSKLCEKYKEHRKEKDNVIRRNK